MARKDRPDRLAIPDLAIRESVARARLDAATARPGGSSASRAAVAVNARILLDMAADAAHARAPRTRRLPNWWSGTLNDVGYRSLHAASAQMATLYSADEIRAVLPDAVGRIQGVLDAADPRRVAAQQALATPHRVDGPRLRQLLAVGYEAADDAYARVRNFRNVVIMAVILILVVGGVFVGYVMAHPDVVPLCFQTSGTGAMVICPSSEGAIGVGGPTSADIVVVCLLGLLGASLSAAVSLRNLQGSSAPYSVPVALAALKVPTGALTATIALIAIRAGFVPGLTALDSQAQIVAYALLFGYAQQLLTGLVDRQGQSVLAGLPGRANPATRTNMAIGVVTADAGTTPPAVTGGADDGQAARRPAQPAATETVDELPPGEHIDDSDLPDNFPQDVSDGGVDETAPELEQLPDDDEDDRDDLSPDDLGPDPVDAGLDVSEASDTDDTDDADDDADDAGEPTTPTVANGADPAAVDVRTLTTVVPAPAEATTAPARRATARRGGSR